MSILVDTILSTLKNGALKQLTEQSGMTPAQGQTAAQSAIPMVLDMFSKQFSAPSAQGGGLLQALGASLGGGNTAVGGSDMIGQLLGGQLSSLSASLSSSAGIPQNQASSFLVNLVPVVMKAMQSSVGADSNKLAGLVAGATQYLSSSTGGAKALTGLLDRDGDGDVDMTDVLSAGASLVGNFLRK